MKLRNVFGLVAVALIAAVGILTSPHELAAHALNAPMSIGGMGVTAIAFGGLIVNADNLSILFRSFNAAFQNGLGMAKPMWDAIATPVPSTTAEEDYGWLNLLPSLREWVGDRQINRLAQSGYTIKNKDFEGTIAVDRNRIQDDKYGIYGPMFTQLGQSTAALPDQLVWALLKAGFATACYDGQYFFDTDHPVLDANGNAQSVANTDAGAGEPWFLVDTSKVLKPIIFQKRQDFTLVRKDQPQDDNVFNRKEYIYGVDGRCNVGYGFWQFAWGSKQTLDAAHYATARGALTGMKGDYARPLGVMPDTLFTTPANEGNARQVLQAERNADGSSNIWFGTAKVVVVPWLA